MPSMLHDLGWSDPLTLTFLVTAVGYVITVIVPIFMLYIVPKDRNPASAIAWLLVIALFPYIGLIIYFILGSPRLPRRRMARKEAMDAILRERIEQASKEGAGAWKSVEGAEERLQPFLALGTNLGGMPMTGGNQVEVISDYDEVFRRMAVDIDAAEASVHVAFYILAMDRSTEVVFKAMERAQARGVEVLVLLDHIGSRGHKNHRAMLRRLNGAGIRWKRMLPVLPLRGEFARPDLRNHRKIVTIDGRVGWAGSQNLIDKTYSPTGRHRKGYVYDDVMIRVRGPVALHLETVFRMDWFAETGELPTRTPAAQEGVERLDDGMVCQVVPSGPSHPYENNLHLFAALLFAAKRKVVLVNPYFVPDDALMLALTNAAKRGVDVTLVTCAGGNHFILNHAQRSYYEALLAAGVRLMLYPTPQILHTKTLTIDDDLAAVGSSNLDMRSFHLNMEVTVLTYGEGVVDDLRTVEDSYIAASTELQLSDWRKRNWVGRWFDSVARLTASLQ